MFDEMIRSLFDPFEHVGAHPRDVQPWPKGQALPHIRQLFGSNEMLEQ
jgi:hypothetical protein